ncbi:MAG: DUF72 domain-containing protein [Granulosicoccus sp.]
MLASYASVFNSVEGNTSFYHVPDVKTVDGWVKALEGHDFQISFKLPRTVTHERRPDMQDLMLFLNRIKPLGEHIGPFLIQYPDWAGIVQLRRSKPVLDAIYDNGRAVIEVRDPALFSDPEILEPLLGHYGFGRVMLDSRALYKGDRFHPDVLAAVHEKPDVPVLGTVYNKLAFVRLILHPDGLKNSIWINEWAERTALWLQEGITPYIMIHCPNNAYCPLFAEQFHKALTLKFNGVRLPDLPAWPVPQQGQLL